MLYAIIAGLPFIVLWWLVPGVAGLTLGNDYVAFPIAHQLELMFALKHGSFPLFVPGFAGGRSASALTLGQLYHPLPHLAALLPGYWGGHALDWCTLLRLASLAVCQLAAFRLLRRLALERGVAFIASFLAVYNLRMLDMFRYGAALENYTGLILLCTSMANFYLSPTTAVGPLAIVGSAYLLITGGHPQIFYLGALAALAVCLVLPFAVASIRPSEKPSARRALRFYAWAAACGLAALLLAAAYWVPLYTDFVAHAPERVGRDYAWSLAWGDTPSGVLASFFNPLHANVHGAFGSSILLVVAAVVPLLLLVGLRVPVAVLALWLIAFAALLVSLGRATPLHHAFWAYFPLAHAFRGPGRVAVFLPILLMLIIAWLLGPGREPRRLWMGGFTASPLLVAGLLAFVAFGAYRLGLTRGMFPPSSLTAFSIRHYPPWVDATVGWAGLLTLVLVVLTGVHARPALLAVVALGVVAQTAVELRYGTWVTLRRATPTLAQMDADKRGALAFRGPAGYGMESPAVALQLERSILEPRLARFYRSVDVVSTQAEAYAKLAATRPATTAVIEEPPHTVVEQRPTLQTPGDRVALARSGFNSIVLHVAAGSDGYLAVAFPYSSHWYAFLDGRRDPVLRADGYELAVAVPQGDHEVAFRYSSVGATAGMAISCAAVALVGLYLSLLVASARWRLAVRAAAVLLAASLFLLWRTSLYGGDLGTRYVWTDRDFPPADDLAYGRRTHMSSIRSSDMPYYYYSGLAVDGDRDGAPALTAPQPDPWWEVDLGAAHEVGTVVVYGAAGPRDLVVRASPDGRAYLDYPLVECPPTRGTRCANLRSVEARYIRLQGRGQGTLSIREVEVFPSSRRPAGR